MKKSAAQKIAIGLGDAVEYARIRRTIHEWIRDDAPLAAKMNLTPKHVSQLVDRICGSTTHCPDVGT
jgi:hypothetical protein